MQRFTESPAQHTHQITHKTNDIGNVQGVRHKGAIIEAHVIRTNIMHPLILSHYVCMRHTKHTFLSFCLNPFFWSMYIHTRPGGGWFDCMCRQFCRLRHIDHSRDEESREGKAAGCLSFHFNSIAKKLHGRNPVWMQLKTLNLSNFWCQGGMKWKLSECNTLWQYQCRKAKMFKMSKEIWQLHNKGQGC